MAKGFASPKVKVIISDGCEYLKQHTNEFDVIITDSSDPDGKFLNDKFRKYLFLLISKDQLKVYLKNHFIH